MAPPPGGAGIPPAVTVPGTRPAARREQRAASTERALLGPDPLRARSLLLAPHPSPRATPAPVPPLAGLAGCAGRWQRRCRRAAPPVARGARPVGVVDGTIGPRPAARVSPDRTEGRKPAPARPAAVLRLWWECRGLVARPAPRFPGAVVAWVERPRPATATATATARKGAGSATGRCPGPPSRSPVVRRHRQTDRRRRGQQENSGEQRGTRGLTAAALAVPPQPCGGIVAPRGVGAGRFGRVPPVSDPAAPCPARTGPAASRCGWRSSGRDARAPRGRWPGRGARCSVLASREGS
jgi:hypothetical protein